MKKLSLLSLAIFIVNILFAQENQFVEKVFDDSVSNNHYAVKRVIVTTYEKEIHKSFEIEVKQTDRYNISAFMVAGLADSTILQVYLDIEKRAIASLLYRIANAWKPFTINFDDQGDGINLTEGVHTITFSAVGEVVPGIESVHLHPARIKDESLFKEAMDYVEILKEKKLPENYSKDMAEDKNLSSRTSSDPVYNYNPPVYDYNYREDIDFNYTYWYGYHFTAGTTVTFETTNNNCDPVMYLFHRFTDPSSHSWYNDDGGVGLNSKLTVTIPTSGHYILLLRAYGGSIASAGVVDLYRNGQLVAPSAPVAGRYFYQYSPKTGPLTHLTANALGDPYLWVADDYFGKIRAHNNDYINFNSDFIWNRNARLQTTFETLSKGFLISSYTISNPTGNCDLYMNTQLLPKNSQIWVHCPKLKHIDAIRTHDKNSVTGNSGYNCHAWAGGIVTNFTNPYQNSGLVNPNHPYDLNPWYSPVDQGLKSFDNYFGNDPPRYAGAMSYTRIGADEYNAAIAVWAWLFPDGSINTFTHSSIKKPGNLHPHGYDWESKIHVQERFMHPKDAIEGLTSSSGNGVIVAYYKPSGGFAPEGGRVSENQTFSFDESLSLGLTVIDTVQFNEVELLWINHFSDRVSPSLQKEFYELLNNWKKEVEVLNSQAISNQMAYSSTPNFKSLLSLSQQNKSEILPLIFKDYIESTRSDILYLLIYHLTNSKYGHLIAEVMKENRENLYNNNQLMYRSTKVNYLKYIKKILSTDLQDEIDKPSIKLYPNPASHSIFIDSHKPILKISAYDLNGRLVHNKYSKSYEMGKNNVHVDVNAFPSGPYILIIEHTEGNFSIVKILINR